jgi:hypothetical protein
MGGGLPAGCGGRAGLPCLSMFPAVDAVRATLPPSGQYPCLRAGILRRPFIGTRTCSGVALELGLQARVDFEPTHIPTEHHVTSMGGRGVA